MTAERKASLAHLAISDPVLPTGEENRFWIGALTFFPVTIQVKDDDGVEVPLPLWPLVVTTCPVGNAISEEVLDALERVAEAAQEIRAHYRTHTYTDGADIRSGPPMSTLPPLLSDATVPAPLSPCTGAGGDRVAPAATTGMMCTSFFWHAVQRANETRANGVKRILLDGRPDGFVPAEACLRTSDLERKPYQPPTGFDNATRDGLYLYTVENRRRAGDALYVAVYNKVATEIEKAIPGWLQMGGAVAALPVQGFLTMAGMGLLAQAASLLGVSLVFLEQIVRVVTDAPDNVANQICSGFASDDCTEAAASSTAWRDNPGVGRTVSPDDVVHNWSPPTPIADPAVAASTLLGLYGRNTRLTWDPPKLRPVPIPPVTWQISQGFGTVRGRVLCRTGNVNPDGSPEVIPMPFARLRFGAVPVVANRQGSYLRERVPSGRYWLDASLHDPATDLYYSFPGEPVVVPEEQALIKDVFLDPPPESTREIIIVVKADLLHRKLSPFADPWRKHIDVVLRPSRLGLTLYPNTPQWMEQHNKSRNDFWYWRENVDVDVKAIELLLFAHLEDDASLSVTLKGRLRDPDAQNPDDDPTPWDTEQQTFPPRSETLKQLGQHDLFRTFVPDFHIQGDHTGITPSHASVDVQVLNLRG